MKNFITIRDIAMAAEVSPTTVSFALRGKKTPGVDIPEATRNRIIAIARQAGYRPNRIARDMVLGRQSTIGLILSATGAGDFLPLIPVVEPILAAAGYRLVVVALPADTSAARERLITLLRDDVAGILCCPAAMAAANQIVAGACPVVLLGPGSAGSLLRALGVEANSSDPSTPAPAPSIPIVAAVDSGIAPKQVIQSNPAPPATLPVTPPAPAPVTKPVAVIPEPVPSAFPTPIPVSCPDPIIMPPAATTPSIPASEITEPITEEDHAADTTATTEENPIPVVTQEECAAPVVTGVSPVQSSDQDTIPVPTPESAPETAAVEETPSVSASPTPAPVIVEPLLAEPTPEPVIVTPEPEIIQAPTPEAMPEPEPVAALPAKPIPEAVMSPPQTPELSAPAPVLEPEQEIPMTPTPEPAPEAPATEETPSVSASPTPTPVMVEPPQTEPTPEPVATPPVETIPEVVVSPPPTPEPPVTEPVPVTPEPPPQPTPQPSPVPVPEVTPEPVIITVPASVIEESIPTEPPESAPEEIRPQEDSSAEESPVIEPPV